ncbi:MAG: glycosyltransferase [Actinomycetota bacterium]
MPPVRVAAVVAARNEGGRVGETVRAIRAIPGVDEVVVADGSSADRTAEEARGARARVLVGPRRHGKGGALEGALERVDPAQVYLFLDADLGATAAEGGVLVDEVVSGRADLAIGLLPREPRHGGFRIVKGAAAAAIRRLSGFRAIEPLSGQRAVSAECLAAVRPLAPGFGVEVAMTVDAVRAGFRVVEVEVAMRHAPTGRDLAGFLHRGRQGLDLARAVLPRALR